MLAIVGLAVVLVVVILIHCFRPTTNGGNHRPTRVLEHKNVQDIPDMVHFETGEPVYRTKTEDVRFGRRVRPYDSYVEGIENPFDDASQFGWDMVEFANGFVISAKDANSKGAIVHVSPDGAQRVISEHGSLGSQYGYCLRVIDDHLWVGAPFQSTDTYKYDNPGTWGKGAVFIYDSDFRLVQTRWNPSGPPLSYGFGIAIASDGRVASWDGKSVQITQK